MNATNDWFITLFDDQDGPAPATERAPAAHLARLVAQTLPPADRSEEKTPFAGDSSVDFITQALRADVDIMTIMRALYVSGDTDEALALAAHLGSAATRVESANDDDDDIEELAPEDVVFDEDDAAVHATA